MAELDEDDRVLAGELALGVLDGAERAAALRRQLADPAFAAEVARWEAHLAPLGEGWQASDVPPRLWNAIAERIDREGSNGAGTVAVLKARIARWRAGAIGAGAIAATLAAALVMRPPVPLTPVEQRAPQRIAAARIAGEGDGPLVLARYDATSGKLAVTIQGMATGQMAPELWVIPANGSPTSLGQMPASGPAEMLVPVGHRALLADGATLAVTMEQPSATPHPAPSSAPVAAGQIFTI